MRRTPLPTGALDATDRAIPSALQVGVPLSPGPFAMAVPATEFEAILT